MYNANAIANYFVRRGIEKGALLTPMQVNKLVFLSHGYYLATTDEPLINEVVYAWKWGPVVSSVYARYREFGRNPIDRTQFGSDAEQKDFFSIEDDCQAKEILEAVWEGYGSKSGPQLSTITHRKDSPWYITWEVHGGKNSPDVVIPDDLIEKYYKEQLATA